MQRKTGFQIRWVNHGIANRFSGKKIELHRKLLEPEFRPLLDEIILHEMNHTDTGYSFEDFKLDFKGFKNKGLYRKFILTTPSSWVQFSPIYISNKKIYFDMTLIITYLVALTIFYFGTKIFIKLVSS